MKKKHPIVLSPVKTKVAPCCTMRKRSRNILADMIWAFPTHLVFTQSVRLLACMLPCPGAFSFALPSTGTTSHRFLAQYPCSEDKYHTTDELHNYLLTCYLLKPMNKTILFVVFLFFFFPFFFFILLHEARCAALLGAVLSTEGCTWMDARFSLDPLYILYAGGLGNDCCSQQSSQAHKANCW